MIEPFGTDGQPDFYTDHGLLRDLHDLWLLANESRTTWVIPK